MQDLTRDVAHVGRMLKAGLGLRGNDMAAQLRSGGRLLPRSVRASAQRLAEAEAMMQAPKLAKQLDIARLQKDVRICTQHLTPLVQNRVHHGWWLRAASWVALALFMGGLAFAGLLHLRGGV